MPVRHATDASLVDDLRAPVEPETRGDPQSPLLGTCKRLRNLSQSRRDMCHKIDRTVIGLASTALTSHRNGTTRLSSLTR